jgi:muconolactone delta-isomerase
MTEFLVDMVTTVPEGTTDAEIDAIRSLEAERSRELAAQGHLLRLWRPPLKGGEWRTWGLFQAADATELEKVLSSMPLRVWRHDTVTPLTAHPSDPGSGDADVLDAVLAGWKAAVDVHQPEQVAALFAPDAIFQGLHPYTRSSNVEPLQRRETPAPRRRCPAGPDRPFRVRLTRQSGPDRADHGLEPVHER